MDGYIWLWLALLVGFVILEAVTAQLVSLWFIIGAAAAFVSSLFRIELGWQVCVFIVVSIASLFALRPLVKRKLTPKNVPTNADMSIGRIAVVSEEVNNDLGKGRAELGGVTWTARSLDGSVIKKGTKTVVHSIDGVKLIVKAIKED